METPDGWINTIYEIDPQTGYYVLMYETYELTITGTLIDPSAPFTLYERYSFVNYYGASGQTALSVFEPLLDGYLIMALSRDGALMNTPGGWIDGIGEMQFSNAYFSS
mgnify:CR=1 FL=1